jgi:uncharacterized protein (DUF1810 family)
MPGNVHGRADVRRARLSRRAMTDSYNLNRFVAAQEHVYPRVLSELRAGRKQSHWMWFIFPQIQGLGHSAMAQRYAVGSLAEAVAYLAHPVRGCANARVW